MPKGRLTPPLHACQRRPSSGGPSRRCADVPDACVESRRQAEKLKGCRLAPTTSFPAFPCENNLSSHSVMRGLRSSNSAADEDVEDDRLPTQSVFQVCRSFKSRLSQFKAVCAPTTDPGEPIQFEDSGMNGFGSKSWLPMPRHIAAPRRRP